MSRAYRKLFLFLGIALVIIIGYRMIMNYFIGKYMSSMANAATTISTTTVQKQNWAEQLSAVGTLVAKNGVDITTQLPGQISAINFISGQSVKAGDKLLQLDDRADQQDFANFKARADLAASTYQRNADLKTKHFISTSDLDKYRADWQSAIAEMKKAEVLINQKSITAPFDCELGIRMVNIGQYVTPGTPFVNCQQLNPLYIDFSLPAESLAKLAVGETVQLQFDAYPNQTFTGKLTVISPALNIKTRNIALRAEIANPNKQLLPGMFANVTLITNSQNPVITIPQTALLFSLSGNSVYVVTHTAAKGKDPAMDTASERAVTIGESRANAVAIVNGLTPGETIVTSGQNKLHNNSPVKINNQIDISKAQTHETLY